MGLMLIMNIVVCKLHITNFLPKNGLKYVTTRSAPYQSDLNWSGWPIQIVLTL